MSPHKIKIAKLAAVLVVVLLAPTFLIAGTVYHGKDFSTIQTRSNGDKRLKVCDRELDTHNAGGGISRRNGTGGFYYTSGSGDCAYSPWGSSGIVYHTVCEGGPYGSCSTHYHRRAKLQKKGVNDA